ncbi:MAG: hypothetical protein II329_00110, partial [Clostridia bacterium]|nr:hypothetical protein [Clostridia bacterium]
LCKALESKSHIVSIMLNLIDDHIVRIVPVFSSSDLDLLDISQFRISCRFSNSEHAVKEVVKLLYKTVKKQ